MNEVQADRFPEVKSSEKIGGVAFPLATVAVSVTGAPFALPSFGVTVTTTTSPASPLPATDRSNESVSRFVTVVRFVVPFTVHT